MSDTPLSLADHWLLDSGIQERSGDAKFDGGVHAWFDLNKNGFSFYYTEITGYYATMLSYLAAIHEDKRYQEAAGRAVRWLINQAATESGSLRCRYNAAGWADRSCSFDNGMCLNGILNYQRLSNDEEALRAAVRIGEWLLGTMRREDGSFFAKFNDVDGPHNPEGKWSLISGAFLIKLSIGLLNLADRTGDRRFADAASDLCVWGLGLQDADGRVRTSPDAGITFLHPHCYAAEGWYVAGAMLNDERFNAAHRKAVEWIASHQLPSGGLPGYAEHGTFLEVESPDMTSQAYRLWQLLPAGQRPALDAATLERNVASYQCLEKAPQQHGGFFSGSAWFHGEAENHEGKHVNSWVTMFSAQALHMADTKLEGWSPFYIV